MDKQLIYNAHEIWAAAQLAQGEGIEDGANRIAAILARIDAERGKEVVAWFAFADNNGPVPLELWGFDLKACKNAVIENARSAGWKGTVEGYLFQNDWTIKPLYTNPQPPEPCPKCVEHIEYGTHHLRRRSEELAEVCTERDALQAKVAEQSAEIGRLTKERDEYNSAWQRSGVEYRKLRDSLLSLAGEFK